MMYRMDNVKNLKLIAVVGMSGAGKTVAVNYLTAQGAPKIYFGGFIYKEMTKRGIEITPASQREFREMIRQTEGNDWVVRQVIAEIRDLIAAGQKRIILDGVYSWTEYRTIKHEFPGALTVLAVIADRAVRYARLAARPERPFTGHEAEERDYSEIEHVEKGGPIAIADHYVLNDGTPEQMQQKLKEIVQKIGF